MQSALTGVQHTDIDVFLVCVSPEEAVTCLRQIIAAVQRHHRRRDSKKRFLVTRSQYAVSFYLSSVPGGADDTKPTRPSRTSCAVSMWATCFIQLCLPSTPHYTSLIRPT